MLVGETFDTKEKKLRISKTTRTLLFPMGQTWYPEVARVHQTLAAGHLYCGITSFFSVKPNHEAHTIAK